MRITPDHNTSNTSSTDERLAKIKTVGDVQKKQEIDFFHQVATNPLFKVNYQTHLQSWKFLIARLQNQLSVNDPSLIIAIFDRFRNELLNLSKRNPLCHQRIQRALANEHLSGLIDYKGDLHFPLVQEKLSCVLKFLIELGDEENNQTIEQQINSLKTRAQDGRDAKTILYDALSFAAEQLTQLSERRANDMISKGSNPLLERHAIQLEQTHYYRTSNRSSLHLQNMKAWVERLLQNPQLYGLSQQDLFSTFAASKTQWAFLVHMLSSPQVDFQDEIPSTMRRDKARLKTLRGDFHALVTTESALAIFKFILNQHHVEFNSEDIKTLQFGLNEILKDEKSTSKEVADWVISHVKYVFARTNRSMAESLEGTLKTLIEKNLSTNNPVYLRQNQILAANLRKYLDSPNDDSLLSVKTLGQDLERVARVYFGVHGQTLHRIIRHQQREAFWLALIAQKITSEQDLPEFFKHQFNRIEQIDTTNRKELEQVLFDWDKCQLDHDERERSKFIRFPMKTGRNLVRG